MLRGRSRYLRTFVALALSAGAAGGPVAAALAQEGPEPGTTSPAPPAGPDGAAVIGTLSSPAGPVAGARIEVSNPDGSRVGEATSAGDGAFRVPVPAAGRYQVRLDQRSLPAGVQLAQQARDTLDNVVVFAGRDKRVTFDLAPSTGPAPDVAEGPSTAERLLDLFVGGARYGLVIALCAVGLTLIYATTGLVNFAHGELVTFGALAAWFASSSGTLTLPLVIAAVIGFLAASLFGGLWDVALWEPLRRRRTGDIAAMVVSIGLALGLRNIYLVVFESNARAYAQYAAQQAETIGPLQILPKDIVSMAVCLIALAATAALLRWSRLGTAVRATSDEPDLARASGIDVRRVHLTVWTLGAGLAGLGGVLLALREGAQWDMGMRVLLVVFAAVVVGGFGSPAGAMLGGLLIGIVAEMATYWLDPDFKDVLALLALVIVLLVRPQGILGVRERVG